MNDEIYPLYRLLKKDRRYPLEAYQFVRDALSFAQDDLNMGVDSSSSTPGPLKLDQVQQKTERHLTGQELCEAIRVYALEQYGYMAKTVLNSWGFHETSDFGNVVYNLISIEWMRKSDDDQQEHFNGVYDFGQAFMKDYDFTMPE